MKVAKTVKFVEKYVIDNAPTILTAFGVTGALTTTYLTVKATFRASDKIREAETELGLQELEQQTVLTNKDKAKLVWKEYIPPAVCLATTVTCIIAAQHINTKRMAALAAAYALTEKQHAAYRDKVKETLGLKKDNEVHAAVSQDAVNSTPVGIVEQARGGDTLCFDLFTGRYFKSDMQTIRAAENDMNQALYRSGEPAITVADFYDRLGLSIPQCAEEVGWNKDHPLELRTDSSLKGDIPVLTVGFVNTPIPLTGVFG